MPLDLAQIKTKIAELEQAIKLELPNYASILNTIHKETREQAELLYKLDDAEIAVLVSGLGHFHKQTIVLPKEKAKITKKQGSQMSEDDV